MHEGVPLAGQGTQPCIIELRLSPIGSTGASDGGPRDDRITRVRYCVKENRSPVRCRHYLRQAPPPGVKVKLKMGQRLQIHWLQEPSGNGLGFKPTPIDLEEENGGRLIYQEIHY
jgi:hypothetical protein